METETCCTEGGTQRAVTWVRRVHEERARRDAAVHAGASRQRRADPQTVAETTVISLLPSQGEVLLKPLPARAHKSRQQANQGVGWN